MNVKGFLQRVRRASGWAGIGALILGPLWGYLAMGLCRLLRGGPLADTLTFYLMVAGWLLMPVGILLLLYRLATRAILHDRRRQSS